MKKPLLLHFLQVWGENFPFGDEEEYKRKYKFGWFIQICFPQNTEDASRCGVCMAFPLTDYKTLYFCVQFSSILYLKASCRSMSHMDFCEISCDCCFGH